MYETSTIAPGVTRTKLSWCYYLEGKKEALIVSGLAEPSWFADWTQRDNRGRIRRSKKLTVEGRKIKTTWPPISKASVWVSYTEAEKQAYAEKQAHRKRSAIRRDAERTPQRSTEAKESLLLCLERRLMGCASVIHSAADDIRDKHEKHPMERPQELRGSSKLGRALHELDIAQRDIGAVVKKLRAAVGPE